MPRLEQGKQVQDLVSSMTEEFVKIYPVTTDEEWELIGEGIENCVCKNLYGDLFNTSEDEKLMDSTIA